MDTIKILIGIDLRLTNGWDRINKGYARRWIIK